MVGSEHKFSHLAPQHAETQGVGLRFLGCSACGSSVILTGRQLWAWLSLCFSLQLALRYLAALTMR